MVRKRNDDRIEQRLVLIFSCGFPTWRFTCRQPRNAINKEDHLSPILSMEANKALSKSGGGSDGWTEHQEPALLEIRGHGLAVNCTDIVYFELSFFDIPRASVGGAYGDFLHSSRLDNLASCFMAVKALADDDALDQETVSMIVLYDEEEVGSTSAVGAASPIIILQHAMALVAKALDLGESAFIRKSLVSSSDQAHALIQPVDAHVQLYAKRRKEQQHYKRRHRPPQLQFKT